MKMMQGGGAKQMMQMMQGKGGFPEYNIFNDFIRRKENS